MLHSFIVDWILCDSRSFGYDSVRLVIRGADMKCSFALAHVCACVSMYRRVNESALCWVTVTAVETVVVHAVNYMNMNSLNATLSVSNYQQRSDTWCER